MNTRIGGLKAAKANLKTNPNFYKDIGRLGGLAGHSGGFASDPLLASKVGSKGGKLGKRGHKYLREDATYRYYLHKESGKTVKFEIETDYWSGE
jgi:general stress protein YciG